MRGEIDLEKTMARVAEGEMFTQGAMGDWLGPDGGHRESLKVLRKWMGKKHSGELK